MNETQITTLGLNNVKAIEGGTHQSRSHIVGSHRIKMAIYFEFSLALPRIPLIDFHSNVLVTSKALISFLVLE